jgi:hypothetical protein
MSDMSDPVRLYDLAKTLRSKNAGVDLVTFDIFFETDAAFRRVTESGRLSVESIAECYGLDAESVVLLMEMPHLRAIKFTLRRDNPSGGPGDSDVFGAQQYAPIAEVIIP